MALLPSIRGLPRTFWVLLLGTFVNRLGGFVVPFLTIYLTKERGLPVDRAGIIVGLFGAGALGAGLVGGFLADRFGRRFTMLVGLVGGAAMMLVLGFVRDELAIAAATFGLGLLGDLYRPAVWAAATDLVPEEDRTRAFGLLYWVINLGFAIAPMIAGVLSSVSFTLLFVADAATTLACAVLFLFRVPETRPARTGGTHHMSFADATAPYRDPLFMAFGAATVVFTTVFMQVMSSVPFDMTSHGISAESYGVVIALNGWMIVFLQPLSLGFVQRFDRMRVMAVAAVITGVGYVLPALGQTVPLYAASVVVWTLGEIAMSPVYPGLVASFSPKALRGTYQGSSQVFHGLAVTIAPIVGTAVLGRWGSATLWVGCLVAALVAAAAFLALRGPAIARARAGADAELGDGRSVAR
ncbi:MFS transporter [Myxococcota bacterium]|nr:MFS transporter [Myxococcota bacterium]